MTSTPQSAHQLVSGAFDEACDLPENWRKNRRSNGGTKVAD